VCVLQVNDARLEPTMVSRIDSMLVDCHWAQMVSYRATRSCSCHLPDHVPAAGHNFDVLFLWPAMSLGCYSRLTPTSWFWQGLWQCCCWADHVLLCLMIGRRLGLFPVSTTLPPWLPPPHRNYPVSSLGSLLAFLHALSIRSQRLCALPLCGVCCNPSNLLDVILLL
jgi:hypothetical protein